MLDDRFAYLILSMLYMLAWLVVFVNNPWKRGMVKVGAIGGIMGVIAEVWYFHDYWRPPTLFGVGIIGIEDFIIGFALFGVGGYVHSSFTRKEIDHERKHKARNRDLFILWLIGCASLTLFSLTLKIHSGYVTFLTFLALSIYIWTQRPDLIYLSLVSGVTTLLITLLIYYINFQLLFPHFWDKYGLLDEPILGIKIIGVPLSEILWHSSWSVLCSMFRGFRNGVSYKERVKKGVIIG